MRYILTVIYLGITDRSEYFILCRLPEKKSDITPFRKCDDIFKKNRTVYVRC